MALSHSLAPPLHPWWQQGAPGTGLRNPHFRVWKLQPVSFLGARAQAPVGDPHPRVLLVRCTLEESGLKLISWSHHLVPPPQHPSLAHACTHNTHSTHSPDGETEARKGQGPVWVGRAQSMHASFSRVLLVWGMLDPS